MDRPEPVTSKRQPQRCTCPTCKGPVKVPAKGALGKSKSFPFCCERCKLIDLGAWLDAEYRLPVRADEELDEIEPGEAFDDIS